MHRIKLDMHPFEMIKSGKKTIELRLYDEKRRRLRAGDMIEFTNSTDEGLKLTARVKALHIFSNFAELYAALDLEKCGYTKENIASASPEDMLEYYCEQKQRKYGVVGIKIEIVKD